MVRPARQGLGERGGVSWELANGFYGDPFAPEDLFTTYNGSTNVAVVGDLIGRFARMWGSFNWQQPVSGARPEWSQSPYNGIKQLLQYPRAVSNAAWTKTNCTPLDGQTSWDGSATATRLTATAAAPAGAIQAGTSYSSTITVQVIAKAGTSAWLRIFGVAATNNAAWFDLTNGVLGTVQANTTAGIESVGNGWWRC
jgi:hypothetical protein